MPLLTKATPVLIVDRIEPRLQGELLIMPARTTFYGSTELGYADPAGNIVVFAEHS